MNSDDIAFVKPYIRRYYFENFSLVEVPSSISQREFGYAVGDSGMIRHVQLAYKRELLPLLMKESPLDVYVSNARYMFPALPMSDKEWQDADIIFDIDAKDMNLKCRPLHTVYVCSDCGRVYEAGRCAFCNSQRTATTSLPCHTCINSAKKEVEKLVEILKDDLGIKSGIQVYFSGNDGFHVHVTGSPMAGLQSQERSDLVDYVRCRGMLPDMLGIKREGTVAASLPHIHEKGWRGRFAREVFGSESSRSRKAAHLVRSGYGTMEKMISSVSENMGVRIDPHVTIDIHRIFRMPGTINSKSGLAKMSCTDLRSFDPYVHAVVIPDEPVSVRASCPIGFELGGKKFGPYKNEFVTVPAFAAMYMVCKGVAHAAVS